MKFTYEKDIKDSSSLNILYDELNDGDKNLFIINTPNQLLAAIEAQNHFKTTNNILLFYITKENDSKYIDKILSLIEFFPYSKAITYKAVKKRNYKSFLKLLNILAKINNYNYMFIGYSSIFYRRIVANVNYNKLYYLDSGMHTATIQEQILNDHNIQVKNPCKSFIKRKLKEKVLSFIYVLNGFKYESCLDDLNFFTIFNLAPYKNEKIVRHSFEYLKNILSVCKNSYMESFLNLTLANHNVNAYVNKKQIIIDQPISNKLITSSAGSILDIYPSELENIKDYQFELQSKLYSLEKDLYSNSLSSYNNYHKKLVNSFVFNDTIYFCKLFNELIDEFINKIEILTKMSIESVIVRFISILSKYETFEALEKFHT
ncbi:MAG: hypothetical protein U9N59_07510 [Campylobacterota bacterium]|nr:hypothetical protein [Campylobacterota bacterium]